MAPMTRGHSPGKVPGADVAAYYRRRAEGGTALIITEGTNPDHPAASGYPNVPGFYGEALDGWKRVVDEVHDAGGAIIPQLWHCGSVRRIGMEPDPAVPGFAPSPICHPGNAENGELPHEMTQGDIDDTIASFVRAAVSARELGFEASRSTARTAISSISSSGKSQITGPIGTADRSRTGLRSPAS